LAFTIAAALFGKQIVCQIVWLQQLAGFAARMLRFAATNRVRQEYIRGH
jgi:hypothetical protein